MAGKICPVCDGEFVKRPRDSMAQWKKRVFCSCSCANVLKKQRTLEEAFYESILPGKPNECWEWLGTRDDRGYGKIIIKGVRHKGHRLSWVVHNGSIPDGLNVLHKCDNPPCVNPHHLFLGTQRDNIMDMVSKGRANPASLLNLRPGAPGFIGAGPQSNKERKNGIT